MMKAISLVLALAFCVGGFGANAREPDPAVPALPGVAVRSFAEYFGWGAGDGTGAEEAATERLRFENYLFLGDSLISNPHYVADLFRARGHQVFAGGGAVIPNFFGVTERSVTVGSIGAMTGTLKGRDFNGVVILLGANDLGSKSADTVMQDYKSLLAELRGAYARPIFVLKVFPVNGAYRKSYGASVEARMERTAEFNRQMEAYCAETEGVWFIDATGGFTGADGYLIRDVGDGLHISPSYYEEFYTAIEDALYATGLFVPA